MVSYFKCRAGQTQFPSPPNRSVVWQFTEENSRAGKINETVDYFNELCLLIRAGVMWKTSSPGSNAEQATVYRSLV